MGRTLAGGRRRLPSALRIISALLTVLALGLCLAVLLWAPPPCFANFGIHGCYCLDSDTCAGCHRTHTSCSTISWTNRGGAERSALLLGTPTRLHEFCFTCHGSAAAGAATNVLEGVYESDEFGRRGARLNGGAFGEAVVGTNHHTYDGTAAPWGGGKKIVMDCGSCHDPHGSSNYRLLKDVVNGVDVGGYVETASRAVAPRPLRHLERARLSPRTAGCCTTTAPASCVLRAELHDADVCEGPRPRTARRASPPGAPPATPATTESDGAIRDNAGDGFGDVMRYPHPVNVQLSSYLGPRPLGLSDLVLPLAQSYGDWTPRPAPRTGSTASPATARTGPTS
jgi:predicted Fe-S protein YdhL (DUF1289 family)